MNKQEFIEKLKGHGAWCTECHDTNGEKDRYVKVAKVRELLEQLDEPQKVKVKQFVADWFEEHKHNLSNSLWEFTVELNEKTLVTGAIYTEFESWFIEHPRAYEFITSMGKGYEVEEEPLYTVTINLDRKYHLVLDEGDGDDEISTTLTTGHDVLGYRYFLTEKEIKSIDERYWAFAVPVKASVEDYEVEEETKWVVKSNRLYFTGITQLIASDPITYNFTTDENLAHVFDDKESAEKEASFFDGTVEKVEV